MATVRTVASLAQSACLDGEPKAAVKAFATLGSGGKHWANEERDLHRWTKNLFDVSLDTYMVKFQVQAPCQIPLATQVRNRVVPGKVSEGK